jgi:hypothetical protein
MVLIPTKETVFADEFKDHPASRLEPVIDRLVASERAARATLIAFLDQQQIPHVDTLGPLRQHLSESLYAPTTEDMHPGRNGYRVIGDVVAAFIKARAARP